MISPSSSCCRMDPGNGPQIPTAPAPRAVYLVRNMLSPASPARLSPPISPPGISTSIETSPEMNIIAPASEVSRSPGCSDTITAGAWPSRTLASTWPILAAAPLLRRAVRRNLAERLSGCDGDELRPGLGLGAAPHLVRGGATALVDATALLVHGVADRLG